MTGCSRTEESKHWGEARPRPLWCATLANMAGGAGDLECLSYLHTSGGPMDKSACQAAAEAGSLACLQYAHQSAPPDFSNDEISFGAVVSGSLECLRSAHKHRGSAGARTCNYAAKSGSLACLAYAHEHGFPWNGETCTWAARAGSLDCLRYAHENGCPWDEKTCSEAARNGHLECLCYAHEHGCPWDEETLRQASLCSQPDCLIYAHVEGCPVEIDELLFWAMYGGSVPCMQYAHEINHERDPGYGWDPSGAECRQAFLDGNHDALRYIHSQGGHLMPGHFKNFLWKHVPECYMREELLERRKGVGATQLSMALCLLFVYAHTKGEDANCLKQPTGQVALQLMAARRAAVKLTFPLASKITCKSEGASAVHRAMACVPLDVIEQIVVFARLRVCQ